jgi:hypothetical protein
MKIFGHKKLAHVADRALRYALGLPLTTVVTGCSNLSELEADLTVAESFTPMTGAPRVLPRCVTHGRAPEYALEGQLVGKSYRLEASTGTGRAGPLLTILNLLYRAGQA